MTIALATAVAALAVYAVLVWLDARRTAYRHHRRMQRVGC